MTHMLHVAAQLINTSKCATTTLITLRASEAAAQCILIGPVFLFVCGCGWVCYHDNSKLPELILTKLGL